jgi:SM-20-related protein
LHRAANTHAIAPPGQSNMSYLDYAGFESTPLAGAPFPHLLVPNFIARPDVARIGADFPLLPGPGAFPPGTFDLSGHFAALIEELTGPRFRSAVERKFGMDLSLFPLVYTVRGEVRAQDGGVHTDSKSKLVTVLLYLNEDWSAEGGRLRLLRSADGLAEPVVEIAPVGGTLLVFRRGENSWHGHLPHSGRRRAVQLNWMRDAQIATREQNRHLWSARIKKLARLMQPGGA